MDSPRRILVSLPNWVGDCVMATPTLGAIRQTFPDAHITYMLKPYVEGVIRGTPWHNELIEHSGRGADGRKHGLLSTVGRLRTSGFDLGVLMNNSFKSALMMRLGKVRRRVGYDREGRGFLLTDRLVPYREEGKFLPEPMVRYFLALGKFLGAHFADPRPELFLTDKERADAAALLARNGLPAGRPYIVLNPGAAFGSAKMWGADKFAAVADVFAGRGDRAVVILCGPNEKPIADAIAAAQKVRRGVVSFGNEHTDLGAVKAVVAGSDLLITNDSGPRHFGVAFDKPVVTIFGSTDPQWTECNHPKEIQLRARVPCGPCALRTCPLDHRCMTLITPEMVVQAADLALQRYGMKAAV